MTMSMLRSFSKDKESHQLLPVLVLLPLGMRSQQCALRVSKGMKWECFCQVNPCGPPILPLTRVFWSSSISLVLLEHGTQSKVPV